MIPRETQPGVDEARLIEEIRAGKTEGFEYFVRQYQRKITRVAYRLLRDLGEADCAAQESFLPSGILPIFSLVPLCRPGMTVFFYGLARHPPALTGYPPLLSFHRPG